MAVFVRVQGAVQTEYTEGNYTEGNLANKINERIQSMFN